MEYKQESDFARQKRQWRKPRIMQRMISKIMLFKLGEKKSKASKENKCIHLSHEPAAAKWDQEETQKANLPLPWASQCVGWETRKAPQL